MMSKKIVLVVAITLVSLLISAATLGYFFYLGPRMEIKSFTEDLAPQVERDVLVSNEMATLMESLDVGNDDETFDTDKFMKEAKELSEKLESAQVEYGDILRQISALESSGQTDGLKQDFVTLNQFYVDEIPWLLEMIDYMEKLIVSTNKLFEATETFEKNTSSTASPDQMVLTMNNYNGAIKTTTDKLKKLDAPESFVEFQDNIITALTDMSGLLDETVQAVNELDVAKLTDLEAKAKSMEGKYDESLDFDKYSEQLDKKIGDMSAKEETVLENARQEVEAIRAKYGERWISDALVFNIEEGWAGENIK